jgi:hypothetical protein
MTEMKTAYDFQDKATTDSSLISLEHWLDI